MTSDNIATYNDKTKELLEDALKLFKDAKDIKYERDNDYIHIEYKYNDKIEKITYDTVKGEIINGR